MPTWLTPDLMIAIAMVFGAGVVRGFSGFGSSMILAASLSAVFGPTVAIPLIMAIETVISFQLIPDARRQADWRTIIFLSLPPLITVPIGALLLTALDGDLTRYIISGIILIFIALLVFGFKNPNPPNPVGSAIAGAVGGFSTGAFGMAGPPVILYFLTGPVSAARIRANLIFYFLMIYLIAITVFAFKGLYNVELLTKAAIVLPGFIIGGFIGARFFKGSSDQLYRYVAMAIVAATAIVSLLV